MDDKTLVERCYLIRKSGYFYRPNAQGYTTDPQEAGLYAFEEAVNYSHPNGIDGPRDGLSYHHMSEFPAVATIEAQATRIEALEAALPDEIDLFRIIRKAGRSDIAKAKAVYDRIQQALESQS